MYRFEILRYDATQAAPPRFQSYELEPQRKMSVLEALLVIQSEQDPSLAFRYACRGAVCGSCAMSIDGKPQLACRVQLEGLPSRRVILEPLPHFEVLRDLVVDMDPFWRKYERVRPWLHAEIDNARHRGMSEADRRRIDQYVNCILCGLCYAACPMLSSRQEFTGPAALAKLYRFLVDSRERRGPETLAGEDSPEGAWVCRNITRCIDVCPKQVRPTDAIAGLRRRLVAHRCKRLLSKNPDKAHED
jgi:succinate dehydrogenase / fumarate reductase iron-sulfur subunit